MSRVYCQRMQRALIAPIGLAIALALAGTASAREVTVKQARAKTHEVLPMEAAVVSAPPPVIRYRGCERLKDRRVVSCRFTLKLGDRRFRAALHVRRQRAGRVASGQPALIVWRVTKPLPWWPWNGPTATLD